MQNRENKITPEQKGKVLIPLPGRDFDPSEAALSWKLLKQAGIGVYFATPDGKPAFADPLMLSGEGLDLWGFIPVLKKIRVLGLMLRANADARVAYAAMLQDAHFLSPLSYEEAYEKVCGNPPAELIAENFDGLILPGGHWARGMRDYLENKRLQNMVARFFDAGKPVGAICHGVVLAARSTSTITGKSVLFGRKTTALTWKLENTAWSMMKFAGRVWDPNYYRTYLEAAGEPQGYQSVEAEVTRVLASPTDFLDVSVLAENNFHKSSGLFRDTVLDSRPAWVVRDGNYVSARWPGDVHLFAKTFAEVLHDFVAHPAERA
jgi:putative intracellular protease/amidase